MASYGGASIFGTGLSMATAQTPREAQINAFFGVNGLECLDGGARGRVTFARGLLIGNSALELNLAENLFRSFHDGQARMLVDNMGNTWPDVRMLAFLPVGRVRQSPSGVFFRPYVARFLHLS